MQVINDLTLTVQQDSLKKINFDIESLRGFAAVFVVWHHIGIFPHFLDPGYKSAPMAYAPSGHFCVLIFFILSGYVIGISNKYPLTWATSGQYIKKRVVRLYPIFFLTLLLALAVRPTQFGSFTIVSNLALLQGLVTVGINPPGWSLHYEMLYYLLFIVVSAFRLHPLLVIGAALLVGVGNYFLYSTIHTPIITSYCYGLIFWMLGLYTSQRLARAAPAKESHRVLLSCLLFMLCIDQYNLLYTLMRRFIHVSFPTDILWEQLAVETYDLAALPIALLIILIFVGKRVPYKLSMLKALFVVSALPKLLYVVKHAYAGDLNRNMYMWPTIFLLASLFFLFVRSPLLDRVGQAVVQVGIRLGALSYGIYLVHFPLLFLFSRLNFFSGTEFTFATRLVVMLGLVLMLSYWLEKVLQPRLKALFFPSTQVLGQV